MSMPGLPFAAGFGLGELQRPARIGVFLRCSGGFVGPDLGGGLAFLDRILLGRGVALLGRGHQRGIDDLPAHGEIAALLELPVEVGEHHVERTRLGQLLAEQPDRVGIRRRRAQGQSPGSAASSAGPGSDIPSAHRQHCSAPPEPAP
jgi:hypothetical protein